MTAALETRAGWCPGALRPMPSGDGLIVRVKPRGATLSPAQAIGIAAAASAFGNGALDLTSHANLQIRGASDASLPALTEALDRSGLLDPDVGAETRRNVMMSPLAGFDPEALLDIRPIVAALENRLVADDRLRGYRQILFRGFGRRSPAARRRRRRRHVRCGLAIPLRNGEGGAQRRVGRGLSGSPHPLRPPHPTLFGRHHPRAGTDPSLDGCDMVGGRALRFGSRATQAPSRSSGGSVPDVAVLLAGWFIMARYADPDLRRMRHAVERFGASAILDAVGLAPKSAIRHPPRPGEGSRRAPRIPNRRPSPATSSPSQPPSAASTPHNSTRWRAARLRPERANCG